MRRMDVENSGMYDALIGVVMRFSCSIAEFQSLGCNALQLREIREEENRREQISIEKIACHCYSPIVADA